MSPRNIVNVPASIRDQLLHRARATKRPFLELLQYYSIERFLYRLSISSHSNSFFLKGALMFRAWQTIDHRPTMDIDLLGKTANTVQNLENICREICEQRTPFDDGILFFAKTVRGKVIQTESEYEGIRIEFEGELNKAIVSMQIDIGFGDIISKTLARAIQATFNKRGTLIDSVPECFSKAFTLDPIKNAQWQSFTHKHQLQKAPELFAVIDQISLILTPILEGLKH